MDYLYHKLSDFLFWVSLRGLKLARWVYQRTAEYRASSEATPLPNPPSVPPWAPEIDDLELAHSIAVLRSERPVVAAKAKRSRKRRARR